MPRIFELERLGIRAYIFIQITRLGFKTDFWPWLRAAMVMVTVVFSLFLYNPRFPMAYGYYQRRDNAICLGIFGLTCICLLQSLRASPQAPERERDTLATSAHKPL